MQMVTLFDQCPVNVGRARRVGSFWFEPYRPYVVPDRWMADAKSIVGPFVYRTTDLSARTRPFHVGSLKPGDRVLFYAGGGGYGDQIMAWPVAKYLVDRYEVELHVVTDPGNDVCWWNFPWVAGIHTFPLQHSTFKMFDFHAILPSQGNHDADPDQPHPVDAGLTCLGIDPDSVPSEMKVVEPSFTPSEQARAAKSFPDSQVAILQLAASNRARSFGPDQAAFIAEAIAKRYDRWHWLFLVDEMFTDPKYRAAIENRAGNLQITSSPEIRLLWALTACRAKAVVGVDSMMVHVAGACGVPAVGLWGITSPASRVKYYRNHTPLWPKQRCPHAPCFSVSGQIPSYCPPAVPKPDGCQVLESISPAAIFGVLDPVYGG